VQQIDFRKNNRKLFVIVKLHLKLNDEVQNFSHFQISVKISGAHINVNRQIEIEIISLCLKK